MSIAPIASCSGMSRLLSNVLSPLTASRCNASGRWWPQPETKRRLSTKPPNRRSSQGETNPNAVQDFQRDDVIVTPRSQIRLSAKEAAPAYYTPRKAGNGFALEKYKDGEMVANYTLYEAAINKCKVPWNDYNGLTSQERTIYLAHLKAINERKLSYLDPMTGYVVFTTSHHLYRGKCCGNGCRHCPYQMENATPEIRKYELSKHRTRPPTMGVHRRTRLNVVDNSALGKEADAAGKLAYCIHVYKQGLRSRHMPHAVLGDKILVAIRGQMRKAYVVGANTHVNYRKHGVPNTDTNNIVLLDEEGNPLGNRVTSPIPTRLLGKRDNAQFAKVLALANKFI
ncbi:unnamed protein product [Caenorhabditis auriculariae]|uniref:Large ribosomal subunit protein uL14m n=1 Tax=Caenorhabditis auriculariae TaxID=2777116 RepID=A0A8S1HTD0_9PELO|nr:unnamed protein product [Caenorhabditis auriculariae]